MYLLPLVFIAGLHHGLVYRVTFESILKDCFGFLLLIYWRDGYRYGLPKPILFPHSNTMWGIGTARRWIVYGLIYW
jgi:hypothetical protein